MNETDAAIQHREVPIEIISKNSSVIQSLDFGHLAFIEENLDYYEKVSDDSHTMHSFMLTSLRWTQQVSLMFLLCAADPKQHEFVLNELIVLSAQPSKQKQTDYLKKWAQSQIRDTWKHALLESLCLIQANRILFELGLDIDELTGRYLPSNLYVPGYIHGTVKRLYKMCEDMTVDECYALINYMKKNYPILEHFKYSDHGDYLELHLMQWISANIISLGQQGDGSSDGFVLQLH